DPAAAQDPANYVITWLGPDGQLGTPDDQVIQPAAGQGGPPTVYNPAATVAASTALTSPTAGRQTVTLLFDSALPAGSSALSPAPSIQAAAFNAAEAGLLAGGSDFARHPVVQLADGQVVNGGRLVVTDLVTAAAAGNLDALGQGTAALTQFHGD